MTSIIDYKKRLFNFGFVFLGGLTCVFIFGRLFLWVIWYFAGHYGQLPEWLPSAIKGAFLSKDGTPNIEPLIGLVDNFLPICTGIFSLLFARLFEQTAGANSRFGAAGQWQRQWRRYFKYIVGIVACAAVISAVAALIVIPKSHGGSSASVVAPIPTPEPSVIAPPPDAALIKLSQAIYREGQELAATINIYQTGYVYVFSVEANNDCYQLYPSRVTQLNRAIWHQAGDILRLKDDLPEVVDDRGNRIKESWAIHFPDGSKANEAEETIIVVIASHPLELPGPSKDHQISYLGHLQDNTYRARGPRPGAPKLNTAKPIFNSEPHTVLHYLIKRS